MSIAALIHGLVTNPVFAGIAGGAGMSAMLFQLRALPKALWGWILRRVTVTLVIDNSDEMFHRLAQHLSKSPYVRKAKWLRMVETYDDQEQVWRWTMSFGQGRHLIRDGGHWFLIWRAIEEKSASMVLTRRETITIRSFGHNQEPIRRLMRVAEDIYTSCATIRVYLYHGGAYVLADRKPARSFDTLFLPAQQLAGVVRDLDLFLASRDLYRARGTPYRRGYLFEGPPGTGKTTLAFCIASYLHRPLYLLNLNTCGGDTGLQAAFNQIESGAIVAIEDIDTARISHDRTAEPSPAPQPGAQPDKDSVTLAGLLNAVDGLATRENRILIVTSNHADKLDPALLRPGRIDRRERIGLIQKTEAEAMTAAFLGANAITSGWFAAQVLPALPMSPAELQGMLIEQADRRLSIMDLAA